MPFFFLHQCASAPASHLLAVGDLLKKSGIEADRIDILVTCCSIYW